MADRIRGVEVAIGSEEQDAVARVLRSGRLVQGEEVAGFEREFSELVRNRRCIAVNSGTSALHLGLLALGIGAGDEVVVPSFTFAATANAVVMAGAVPVFADIDAATYCLDPASVKEVLTERTRAVIAVHLYGQPAPMDELRSVTDDHALLLVEDAAQAHAASLRGEPAGTMGDLAAFSFYATKNMTTGEGGMIVCRNAETARRAALLRNQGMQVRYRNEIAGLNNRMTEMAAAIGRVQLRRLDGFTERRRAIAAAYDAGLLGVETPFTQSGAKHVFHQYTVRSAHRDALHDELDTRAIDSAVYYPVPTHRLPAYRSRQSLPETDRAAAEVLSLPMHPGLADEEIDAVIDAVNDISRSHHA